MCELALCGAVMDKQPDAEAVRLYASMVAAQFLAEMDKAA